LQHKLNIKRTNIQICYNMAKKIEVTPEVRGQLMSEFEMKNPTSIYKALGYETSSELAEKIRKRALELGGKEWFTKDE